MAEEPFYRALRRTAWGIETTCEVGRSKRLNYNVYERMTAAQPLFDRFAVRYSNGVTKTEEVYFDHMLPLMQELAVQHVNIIRYFDEVSDYEHYLMNTRLDGRLNDETYRRLHDLVDSTSELYDLDENNIPKKRRVNDIPMTAYERHMVRKKNFIFVDTMKDFRAILTPYSNKPLDDCLRAGSPLFQYRLRSYNIMLAY